MVVLSTTEQLSVMKQLGIEPAGQSHASWQAMTICAAHYRPS